jgi:hypothetical protein
VVTYTKWVVVEVEVRVVQVVHLTGAEAHHHQLLVQP